ncbi:hypothetical protein BH688_14725 [Kushneria phosphatilytica]|nr:hypothetical protein BH688_14725 [Kushneria phosphatilytica]
MLGMKAAICSGIGQGVLPCYLGDSGPARCSVGTPLPELGTDPWLLTHADLRRIARVRIFMDFVTDAIPA